MDQVKVYLVILKKHHFWLLASLAALVGVICWWMGSKTLATEYTKNKSTVDSKFKSISGLNGELPNASFATGVNKLNEKVKTEVFEEWNKQYERQHKLFKWPDVELVKDIDSIPPGEPLGSDVRRKYKTLVFPNELERIYTIANVRRGETKNMDAPDRPLPANGQAAPPAEPDAAAEAAPVEDGLVVWDSGHRSVLFQRYDLVHKARLEITETDLRTAQEDMWVLEQLAKIIAKTNEGATDEAALAIKRIAALDVAQWAVEDSQRSSPTLRLPKPTATTGTPATTPPPPPAGGEDAAQQANSPDALQKEDTELLEGRYLNDANQPASADDTSFAEFKRIFVRMKLDVDQRKLNDLLVNCANSELPLDVLKVQVEVPLQSKEKPSTTTTAPAARSTGAEVHQEIIAGPYDAPVEIYGVIQIYNRPDETKIAQGTGDPTKRSLDMPTGKVKTPRMIASRGPAPR